MWSKINGWVHGFLSLEKVLLSEQQKGHLY